METLELLGNTYTVTSPGRRSPRGDRTSYTLTGPRGAWYVYTTYDNGRRMLTNLRGQTREWHEEVEVITSPEPVTPPVDPKVLANLRAGLARSQKDADRASAARFRLPPGSTRARVTTANANWMIYCETRDKFAQRLYELTGEIA